MSGTEGATATIAGAGTATDPATTTTTTAPAGTGTTDPTGTAAAGQPQQPVQDAAYWQAEAEKWKANSRKNEANAKANREAEAAQKQLLAEVAAKLGIQGADGQPDPKQISAQLEAAQQQNRATALEVAVLRAAGRLGADGDALLDSRTFRAQLDGLDPTQPEGIVAVIQAALTGSPGKYGTAPAPGTAGTAPATATATASTASTFDGSPGGNRQWTDEDVARAKPAELQKAMDAGLLKNLLGSR